MPIYAYRCASCGHAKDVLQKVSDAPLTVCPACGAATFAKQLTAAGFQLKGSGWYATDFKGGKSDKKADTATDGGESAKTDASKSDTKTTDTKTDGGKPGDRATPTKSADASSSSSAPKAAAGGRSRASH